MESSQKKYRVPREENKHRVIVLQCVDTPKFTGHHLWGLPNKQKICLRMVKNDR